MISKWLNAIFHQLLIAVNVDKDWISYHRYSFIYVHNTPFKTYWNLAKADGVKAVAKFTLAAKAAEGIDPAAAQNIVKDTVTKADPASFKSLSPASAGSLTTTVRVKIIYAYFMDIEGHKKF